MIKTISEIPSEFTFPYLYATTPITNLVIKQVTTKLPTFKTGHMIGVLIVETIQSEYGYLTGVSGSSTPEFSGIQFVPRVIDEQLEQEIKNQHHQKLSTLTSELKALKTSNKRINLFDKLERVKRKAVEQISELQIKNADAKKQRKHLRQQADESGDLFCIQELNQQSVEQKKALKSLKQLWKHEVELIEDEIDFINNKINFLEESINKLNEDLVTQINKQFVFTNLHGTQQNLSELSEENLLDGAADEAIVKLLHFAFENNLKPISFAQFWWGASPNAEVRHHGRIYPVSRTKTKSILNHLLFGLTVEPDPLLIRLSRGKLCQVIYQDADLAVINKPTDLLSVPGIEVTRSVYSQMSELFPEATGPIIVHRLDMATSGLMVVALNKSTHKALQKQFIQRSVKKRYEAVLEGTVNKDEGVIKLPLRPDLADRPRQVVCDTYGRFAETRWQKLSVENQQTRVYFFPKTGRSHQLRMHAAHQQGLAMPIVGDDLYGIHSAERLHLHADFLEFVHPTSLKTLTFQLKADF